MPYLERHEETIKPAGEYRPETAAFRDFFVNWCGKNQSPLHAMFADEVAGNSASDSGSVKRQFVNSVFYRGTEMLVHNMPAPALPGRTEGQTLYQVIQPDRLGAELGSVRATGNIAAVSAKEHEIADVIQGEISKIDREFNFYLPADILLKTKNKNSIGCVGASMLGGALMERAGVNYLVGSVPQHSLLFLITSDGHIGWQDMFHPSCNEDLTDDMITGVNPDGSPLTTADIIAFSKHPHTRGVRFEMPGKKYRDKLRWIEEGEQQSVSLFAPGHGQEVQALGNLALLLYIKAKRTKKPGEGRGLMEQAIETYQMAVDGEPQLPLLYTCLGDSLNLLNSFESGAVAYKRAIQIDPDFIRGYSGLVDSYCALGRREEALAAKDQLRRRTSKVMTRFNTFMCTEAERQIDQLDEGRKLS